MLRKATLLILLIPGCAPYLDAQSALVNQTRKGLDNLEHSLGEKSQIVRAFYDARRKQLDDAFDQDVRQRAELSSEWIIEHRRAYASALDAISSARESSKQNLDADRRTIAAMRAALDRLKWLQSMQFRFTQIGGSDGQD